MFSSRTFLSRFHEYSRRRRLFGERSKIIVAVSGGVDSMVLLDLLTREREALGLTLSVAHFNHQLRGSESDADEHLVQQRGEQLGLEVYVDRAGTAECARQARQGIQEAARNLRYSFFFKLLESSGFDLVATAHNADDNAETVLMNLFRGAGVQGLAGIPVLRPDRRIVRPLLFARREEIEAYAAAEGVSFRTDASNAKDDYTRNYVRHQILPLVREQINPKVVETLQRTSELFRELEGYLMHSARAALDVVTAESTPGELKLSIPRLKGHPVLLQQYLVMLATQEVTGQRPDYEQVGRILDLTDGKTGSWVTLPDRHGVYRDRDTLVIRATEEPSEFSAHVLQNHRYAFRDFEFSSTLLSGGTPGPGTPGEVEYIDADQIPPGHLVLRSWSEGDWFIPLGMNARKKISDYFVDAKIPLYEKRHYPILETKDGTVIWLCGQRIDDRFRLTDRTVNILKLEFHRAENGQKSEDHRGQ